MVLSMNFKQHTERTLYVLGAVVSGSEATARLLVDNGARVCFVAVVHADAHNRDLRDYIIRKISDACLLSVAHCVEEQGTYSWIVRLYGGGYVSLEECVRRESLRRAASYEI